MNHLHLGRGAALAALLGLLACTESPVGQERAEDLATPPGEVDLAPAPQVRSRRCTPASLELLNQDGFRGATNGRLTDGLFDLEFDELCNAYGVTFQSGQDFVRQLSPQGALTVWGGAQNLNMGEVAVLRVPTDEFLSSREGEVIGTYICCAGCGCTEDGRDQRQGVFRLDRLTGDRPLPNVLPATPTVGAGPFANTDIDTGPYGLTFGMDRTLYVGNTQKNGDFVRVELDPPRTVPLANLPARVVAAGVYDPASLLVAIEGGRVYKLRTQDGSLTLWATLDGDATSLQRDFFTGRIYAEIRTTPPTIVEISADGARVARFQTPPALGRIAISPDGGLYHLSVYPSRVGIVRWPLPARLED